jgi:hypothetical protein
MATSYRTEHGASGVPEADAGINQDAAAGGGEDETRGTDVGAGQNLKMHEDVLAWRRP